MASFGSVWNGIRALSFADIIALVGVPHIFISGVGWHSLDGASSCRVCVVQPESSTACLVSSMALVIDCVRHAMLLYIFFGLLCLSNVG